jgi:16S rRNA processing protein RimM
MEKDDMFTLPYCVYESERWRNERTMRRLIWVIILTVVLLFASNGIRLYAWMQYDYSSEDTTYQQDGEGYNNINQVLNYLKLNVYIKRSDLELNQDEYILDDLIGLNVVESGETLGKVSEIVYNGINVLLSISGENNFYIPKNGNFIKKVDLENGIIEVKDAKGLIL